MMYVLMVLSVLILIIALRTWQFKHKELLDIPYVEKHIDIQKATNNLSKAVQYKTISKMDEGDVDYESYVLYNQYIHDSYPLVFKTGIKTVINDHSYILKIPGRSQSKEPILLTAHYDVVPASDETLNEWLHGPFSGRIAEGFVWGRGTLDDKVNQIMILEALEVIISEDKLPDYDIYLAFGHDEETGGKQGAKKMAEYFLRENITFRFVLDEGGAVTERALSQVKEPVAVIGTCEKGFSNIRLSTVSKGGHTSMPPKRTGLYHIAKAVTDLEEQQMKLSISKPVMDMLKSIGPNMGLVNRVIIANLWLFKPLFIHIFSKSVTGNALLRTTCATTMAKGADLANILPQNASATFSFRIAPKDKKEDLLKHIKKVINNDLIEVEPLLMNNPSNISPVDCDAYGVIKKTVSQLFPGVIVAPYLMLGGSDARHYEVVSKHVYRFCPYQINNEDLSRIHGYNERISIDNLNKGIQFFIQLIENAN